MTFSKNLKRYLETNKLSLKELADTLGVPSSTVHGWLNGIVPKNLITLRRISEIFNCTIDQLCFGEGVTSVSNETHLESDIVISLGDESFKIILKKIKR